VVTDLFHTDAGLNIPLILIESLGAAYITTFGDKTTWQDSYNANGVGGLIAAGLSPLRGFGKFLSVLMALSSECPISIIS
jgi:hypothetical protein